MASCAGGGRPITGLHSAPAGARGGARTAAAASAPGATGCASRARAEAPAKPASVTERSRKKTWFGEGHVHILTIGLIPSRAATPWTGDDEEWM